MAKNKKDNIENDKAYYNLYHKIYRLKKEAEQLTREQKHGYRTARSKIYAELVELNKELIELSKKKGVKNRRRERVKRKKNVYDVKNKTENYTQTVWEAENLLRDWLKLGTYKKFYLVNLGKVFNTKSRHSQILSAFDVALNDVYLKRNATTPFVDITEDGPNSILTYHILA